MEYKDLIQDILKNASKIANDNFGKVSGVVKEGDSNQILTETDTLIGENIALAIKKEYPEHNIIDEEIGIIDNGSQYTWVIDPIDGTSNFAQGIPNYGIIIGLLQEGTPIIGGVALPFFSEIYLAEIGKGAYCNEKKMQVSSESRLLSSLVAYSIDGHQEKPELTRGECGFMAEIILDIMNIRSSGSVYDAMMVAKGKYGGYLNKTSRIWDGVGQCIIIKEAGGLYTDFFGNPVDYSNPLKKAQENFTWCMGAPQLHKELQSIIHRKSTS